MEDGFDLADLREFDPMPSEIHGVMLRHLKGLYRVLLRLEPWKSFLLPEEPGESGIKILGCSLE